jgi:hypothetical protein
LKKLAAAIVLLTCCLFSTAQDNPGYVNGNVQVLWQQYNADSLIGATVPAEKTGMNAFANLLYTKGRFSAGIRYETYLPPVLGYPGRFKGTGLGYRFARYQHQNLDVTIGNFYDQFGSGLIFRTYEDRNLGLDNAMDGMRVIWTPVPGVTLKGLYGKQRLDFDSRLINGDGIIRAVDGEIFLNDAFPALTDKKTKITIGGSFVSKFQPGETIERDGLEFSLPSNVGASGGRINVIHGGFNFFGEYVQKINDPNADNGFIYKDGQGIFAQAGYSQRGFGVNLTAKTVDNMSFRSDRDLLLFDVPINFIPAVTKQHTYNLAATLYPYGTVVAGEASYSAEVFYKFKKGTPLGGKYGTNIAINYAAANSLDTTHLSGTEGLVDGYERNSWFFGDQVYVRDFNVELKKKINKKLKLSYTYFNFVFNTSVTPVTTDFKGIVYADIHVAEVAYKIKPKHSIRAEAQVLFTNQDKGDWATALVEYNWSPHWFFSVLDQYNYGNSDPIKQIHYLYGTMGYINGSNRISVGYGKRREGIFCVGGVCRTVPASNGLEITVTSSF